MAFSIAPHSLFAADCTSAIVQMVGAAPGTGGAGSSGMKVELVNNTAMTVGTDWEPGGARVFYIHESLGKEGLAILLTAIGTETPIWARLGGEAEPGALLSIIYLNKR